MRLIIYMLCIALSAMSCAPRTHSSESKMKDILHGNWKTASIPGISKGRPFIFTFQDSTCTYVYPYGVSSKYWISGDTLLIKERTRKSGDLVTGGKFTYAFLIDSISAQYLSLIPTTEETKKLFGYDPKQLCDTLQLTKINPVFDWQPERIAFYSTGCFGVCPSMYLEIDSTGMLYFYGGSFTEKEGFYSGKLSRSTFDKIRTEINCIALDSLQPLYQANWTDDQTCGVRIKTADTVYTSSAYGFDQEPVELRVLFHTLMETYKTVDLVSDSTVEEKFTSREFPYSGYPHHPGKKNN